MKSTEAALLCRYVAACCPQQKFDEFTPDAWFDLLGDLPFDLAKRAAAEVAKRQPFVSPSEIRTAADRMRSRARHAYREERRAALEAERGTDGYEIWWEWMVSQPGKAEIEAEADRRIGAGAYDFAKVPVVGEEVDGWSYGDPIPMIPGAAAKIAATAQKLAIDRV